VAGTLIPVPSAPGYGGPAGTAFLYRINRALLLGAGGAVVVALLIGVLLARALTQWRAIAKHTSPPPSANA